VKKLVVLFALIFIHLSCNPEDDKPIEFQLELVTIERVRLPEVFIENQTYEIEMEYIRPSVCHFPNAVRYSQTNEQYSEVVVRNKSVVNVSVENIIFKGSNCDAEIPKDQQIEKAVLKLKIDQPVGTIYELNFLKERDTEGNPIYFVEQILVVSEKR